MSGTSLDFVDEYLTRMVNALSGDRGQIDADLRQLINIIRGDAPEAGPGPAPREPAVSRNVQMKPSAATPKTKKVKAAPKAKAKAKVIKEDEPETTPDPVPEDADA